MATPKAAEQSQDKKKETEKLVTNGIKKNEPEELVIPSHQKQKADIQSEEDQTLKNDLETLVERLKVMFA
jgi:hypothetical protein